MSVQLTYYIGLTDKNEVEEQLAINHTRFDGKRATTPGLVYRAPLEVSATFGAPIAGWAETGGPGPYTWSPHFAPTAGGSAGSLPLNVATFERSAGGFWGWVLGWLFKTKFYWVGTFVHIPDDTLPGDPEIDPLDAEGLPIPPAAQPIQQRRWIEGWEAPYQGNIGGDASPSTWATPDASRHMGGFGAAIRGRTAAQSQSLQTSGANNPGAPAASAADRERFYIRVRRRPSGGEGRFWWCRATAGDVGVGLAILPTGGLGVYSKNGAATYSLLGTTSTPFELGRWYRIDVSYSYSPAIDQDGHVTVYINGVSAFVATVGYNTGLGLGFVTTHSASAIGHDVASNYGLELDIDDWVCVAGALDTATIDWRNGSAVVPVRVTGYGAGHNAAAWAGDWRMLLERPIVTTPEQGVVSSTALSRLEVTTDAAEAVDAMPGAIGVAAIIVSSHITGGAGVPGDIGYSLAGGADVMETPTGLNWNRTMYRPVGSVVTPIAPFNLIFIKDNTATARTVNGILAQAECIGVFGPEDSRLDDAPGVALGDLHNYPYPRSPWTRRGATFPISPVAIYSGAYTGNGPLGGQDLEFPTPIHWFWSRPAGSAGTKWWSSMVTAHAGITRQFRSLGLVFQFIDPAFVPSATEDSPQTQSIVRVGGSNANSNVNGTVYQYVAVTDPGMRFMLNTAFSHRDAADGTLSLIKSAFQAIGAWLWQEDSGTVTAGQAFKGPGHAAASYQDVNNVVTANGITMVPGELQTQDVLHSEIPQVAVSLWRMDDGSDDEGKANVCSIFSYTGDGAASRSLQAPNLPTVYPLFAYVQPSNAAGAFRDPMHTGVNSSNASTGGNVVTSITGGSLGGINVGAGLNTNGIVYNVFIIWGGDTPSADGWTPAPIVDNPPDEFVPVMPIEPVDPPYPVAPDPDDDPGLPEDPDPDPDAPAPELEDDLAVCPLPTHRVVNRALAKIGQSIRVDDLATEQTEAAIQARLHFNDDARATLAAFPWPFATAYAVLTLVEGTAAVPVNGDWTYAYREPSDSVFPRRLVIDRNGAVDPTPPPFQLGHDVDGVLIYTNQADAVLEYTARVPCVAAKGEPLFLEAFEWKLAASLAPPLTRMADKETTALERFGQIILQAEQVIRPGVPGAPPTIDPEGLDAGAGCDAANTDAVNRALVRIGARTITSLASSQSREAATARTIFEAELRSTLRDFTWPFATFYSSELTLVDGALDDPANRDWTYAYRLPSDVLYARRLIDVYFTGRRLDAPELPYRLGRDATGPILYTNEETPILEYTVRPACALAAADDLFRDAFSWRMAFSLAPSLATIDPEVPEQVGRGPRPATEPRERPATRGSIRERAQRTAWAMYQLTLSIAKAAAANESQRDTENPDAPWIAGR